MTWTRYAHRYLHRLLIELDPSRFGRLTFEHADCGCPTAADVDGRARHEGHASQDGDTWDPEWVHTCTSGWCDRPCAWAPEASRSEFELHRVDL